MIGAGAGLSGGLVGRLSGGLLGGLVLALAVMVDPERHLERLFLAPER